MIGFHLEFAKFAKHAYDFSSFWSSMIVSSFKKLHEHAREEYFSLVIMLASLLEGTLK